MTTELQVSLQEQIDILNELVRSKDLKFNTALNQLEVDNIMLRRKLAKLEEQLAEAPEDSIVNSNGVGEIVAEAIP